MKGVTSMSASDEFDKLMADATEDGVDNESQGIKNLRKEFERIKKLNADLSRQLEEQTKTTRASALKSELEKLGGRATWAKWVPEDLEVSAVETWLKENGEDLGWSPKTTDTDAGTTESVTGTAGPVDEDVLAARRIAAVQPQTPGLPGGLLDRLSNARTPTSDAEAAELSKSAGELSKLAAQLLPKGFIR